MSKSQIIITTDPYNDITVVQKCSNSYERPIEQVRYVPRADGNGINISVSSDEFARELTGLTGTSSLLEAKDKLTGKK